MSTGDISLLLQKIRAYAQERGFDVEKIEEAYKLAENAHKEQKRATGEPYIIHPITVAYYLTEYGADEATLIAAFLHDAIEDTDLSLPEVKRLFGDEAANIVDGATKFSKAKFRDARTLDRKIESLRKWFEIMQKDIRVAVIKLVDRIHNMETLGGVFRREKEERIANETLHVFVKIADKLSTRTIKEKLANLAINYLDPESAKTLQEIQQQEVQKAKKMQPSIRNKLKRADSEKKILSVDLEAPSLLDMYENDIHHKEEIRGALPLIFAVTTRSVADCYTILYLIHKHWKVENHSIHDFINTPAANGYQGLHTTVLSQKGQQIVFKIRTEHMDRYAQDGVLLYCFLDTKKEAVANLGWVQQLAHVTDRKRDDSEDFWHQLQGDILEKKITVHDNDKALLIPARATALDAALYSYGEKAWQLEKVFINGSKKPLYKQLRAGDKLHFSFGGEPQIQYEWLDYSNTALGNSLVTKGLEKTDKKQKISAGEQILRYTLLTNGLGFITEISTQKIKTLLKEHKLKKLDDVYEKIAAGTLSPEKVVQSLRSANGEEQKNAQLARISITYKYKEDEPLIFDALQSAVTNLKKYDFSKKKRGFRSVALASISEQEKNKLQKRLPQIAAIEKFSCFRGRAAVSIAVMIGAILLLWGIDPTLVYYGYHQLNILPEEIILFRFWGPTLAFFIWSGVNVARKQHTSIPLFNKYILLATISFVAVVYLRYEALWGTAPSYQMILHRNYIFLTTLAFLPWAAFVYNRKYWLSVGCALLGSFLLLDNTPDWDWQYKWLTIAAFLSFAFFHIVAKLFLKNFSIRARYYQFIGVIHLYGALAITAFSDVPFERILFLVQNHMLFLTVIVASIFLPYMFMYHFIVKQPGEKLYLNKILAFTWIVTILSEAILMGNGPERFTPTVIMSGILMTLGVLLLVETEGKKTSTAPLAEAN